ncbi:ferredoxin [Collibacillus ludicampi]|jgi:ferredoxin like protein|uniref:Ferredoxin-like protein n=1 Tax=Collibacillus ludicampi TaxID=2771369 RepID=A0AAV4LAK8_9BACL|nr:4Fe-4S dicluster domain-containing protein [Collibacillus ludicampi]GIM44909.1 ferredoxin [Collibacillus ludicampi]
MSGGIEDKLFTIRFKVDENSHLIIKDQEVCKNCATKECNYFCPADVYHWEGAYTSVAFENCIECGTCRIGCPTYNIEWVYPKGGHGITYKFG